jgi:hypothetical protein
VIFLGGAQKFPIFLGVAQKKPDFFGRVGNFRAGINQARLKIPEQKKRHF